MMLMHELRTIGEESVRKTKGDVVQPDCNLIPCFCVEILTRFLIQIEFLTSGRVCADHSEFKDLSYRACLAKLSSSEKMNEFTHSFKMARAYSDDIMPFTNYTFNFKGIIDYIFYSKQYLNPLGLLGPLDHEWLTIAQSDLLSSSSHPIRSLSTSS